VTLARDGEALLAWELEGARIVAPAPYAEATGGFARWADATFDADGAEAAVVLKRACSIGMSRGLDLDSYDTLADMPGLSPLCWSMQPDRAPVAFRNRGLIGALGYEGIHVLHGDARGAGGVAHRVESVQLMDRNVPPIGVRGDELHRARTRPADDDRDLRERRRHLTRRHELEPFAVVVEGL